MERIEYIWNHLRIITSYTEAEKKELAAIQELYRTHFQKGNTLKQEKHTDATDDCVKGTLFETKENGHPLMMHV